MPLDLMALIVLGLRIIAVILTILLTIQFIFAALNNKNSFITWLAAFMVMVSVTMAWYVWANLADWILHERRFYKWAGILWVIYIIVSIKTGYVLHRLT